MDGVEDMKEGVCSSRVSGRFVLWGLLITVASTQPSVAQPRAPESSTDASIKVTEIKLEAAGPPSLTCAEALGNVEVVVKPVTVKRRTSRVRKPDELKVESVLMAGNEEPWVPIDPMLLPVQPLEGRSQDIAAVGAVLKRAEAGESIRISVFGDSHTSSEWFTGRLRRKLQAEYGDKGHGFILPAALYKWYRGSDVNLCRTDGWRSDYAGKKGSWKDGLLGFAGMSASSSNPTDFGWVQTTVSNPQGRKVSAFDVYTLNQPGGGTLLAQVDGLEAVAISTANSEQGLSLTRLRVPDGPHRLVLSPKGDGEVRIFGVSLEREATGVIVDAMGINGRQAFHSLEWKDNLMFPGIQSLGPDLVILQYGTNEANEDDLDLQLYREQLRKVIARFKKAAPGAACLLIGPTDRAVNKGEGVYEVWDMTAPIANVQRQLASEVGCVFWDWQKATGGEGSLLSWRFHEPRLASKDLIHLSKEGYEISADNLLKALKNAHK
jgi:lysophospholipase L1-like esterase